LKVPKTVRFKTFLVSLTLVSVIFLASIAYVASNGSFTAPNIYLDDLPSTASYTVKTDGTYFWAVHYDGKIPTGMSGTNDDLVIQYAINNCTSSGGSVLVKSGSYTASVTLKDNVTLTLDKGARGITVTIDSGADGTLVDYENGYRKEWVSGSLYTFMDLRTGKLWWQGENRTDTLAYPEQTASYIVFQDGSLTKMKNCTTGQIDASSTVDSDTINWAIGNGTDIFIKAGHYLLTNELVITGENQDWPTKQTILRGEGEGTILEQTATNTRLLVVKHHACFGLYDLKLVMRETNAQIALHLSSEGGTGEYEQVSCVMSQIDNVFIYGGDTTHPLALFENFFSLKVGFLKLLGGQTSLKLYNNSTTTNYGNSRFDHLWVGYGGTCNLEITGNSAQDTIMNLLSFGYVESASGPVGIYIHEKAKLIAFDKVTVEYTSECSVRITDGASGVTFGQLFGDVPTNGYFLDLNGSSSVVVNSGGLWERGSTPYTVIRDINNNVAGNVIRLSVPHPPNASYYVITSWAKPSLQLTSVDVHYNPLKTPNQGQASIGDGGEILHYCGFSPTTYWVQGTIAGEFCSVTAINSTTLTVAIKKHDGTAGTTQTVIWYAAYYP